MIAAVHYVKARAFTYEVRIQEGTQELYAAWKGPEDLRGGEGGVQEQAQAHMVKLLAQQGWQYKQVVIMHPHKVLVDVDDLYQLVCKCLHEQVHMCHNDIWDCV